VVISGHCRRGFTAIEILVVCLIILLLASLLFPGIGHARRRAASLQCQSNLRVIGQTLAIYQNENHGWFYPVVIHKGAKHPHGRGIMEPVDQRWPVYAFKIKAAPYMPEVLRCPVDENPVEDHTYVLNDYAGTRFIKAGSKNWGDLTVSEVIEAGEKYTMGRDYFLEHLKTLDSIFDWYHHGPTLFSNYLYFDGHVASASPADAKRQLNPWHDNTAE
jgi:prepilin-type N-terminal cleavage/methylation domain-containing protein/prepilin-type processing-associated H-X9-DG protein